MWTFVWMFFDVGWNNIFAYGAVLLDVDLLLSPAHLATPHPFIIVLRDSAVSPYDVLLTLAICGLLQGVLFFSFRM